MASPHTLSQYDKDLDDADLWAVIDSAAAASHSSSKSRKPLAIKNTSPHVQLPSLTLFHSPKPTRTNNIKQEHNHPTTRVPPDAGEVLQENWTDQQRPLKIARTGGHGDENRIVVAAKPVQRMNKTSPSYSSPESGFPEIVSPVCGEMRHSLSGRFPTVSLFKEYQNAAMAILEKTDYTIISGSPFIKKSGWRKIAFYFNISFEIKDKSIEFDDNRNVIRSEFVVRAHMQGGRFSDGWGSCERREKRFMKPNHDIPSTAETRAKNKACQDLLGIGQYKSPAS